jgi:alpha-L-arabinofuranosidase
VVATKDPASGEIIVKVVNPAANARIAASVWLDDAKVEKPIRQWRIESKNVDDANSLEKPEQIRVVESKADGEIKFPPHSVTVLRFAR